MESTEKQLYATLDQYTWSVYNWVQKTLSCTIHTHDVLQVKRKKIVIFCCKTTRWCFLHTKNSDPFRHGLELVYGDDLLLKKWNNVLCLGLPTVLSIKTEEYPIVLIQYDILVGSWCAWRGKTMQCWELISAATNCCGTCIKKHLLASASKEGNFCW